MIPTTEPQSKVLEFVASSIATGRSPSLNEIRIHFGWASTTAANAHVKALIRKGYLERQYGARGLKLTGFSLNAETVSV